MKDSPPLLLTIGMAGIAIAGDMFGISATLPASIRGISWAPLAIFTVSAGFVITAAFNSSEAK